jgi:hypothetical protein
VKTMRLHPNATKERLSDRIAAWVAWPLAWLVGSVIVVMRWANRKA